VVETGGLKRKGVCSEGRRVRQGNGETDRHTREPKRLLGKYIRGLGHVYFFRWVLFWAWAVRTEGGYVHLVVKARNASRDVGLALDQRGTGEQ
jgi:hypothetical protein